MNGNMKLPPSQWIAHDITESGIIPKTLRVSLLESKAAYIWQRVVPKELHQALTIQLLQTGVKPSCQDLVDEYEDQIPDNIKFIIVTLTPRWETEN